MKIGSVARTYSVLLGISTIILQPANLHAQQIQVSGANRTISITTTEEATRRADTAVVHIGFQIYASSSTQVNTQAGTASKAITAALAQAGVAKNAIESESQSTSQTQEYQNTDLTPYERAGRKFQAQQSWTVHTSADGASQVLASAVAAGANESGAIDWLIADEASLSAEAAGKALKHAQAIAEQMASGLGAKLGPLVFASNEAQSLQNRAINGRSLNAPAAPSANAAEQRILVLNTPMVRRSATVSAVFSLQ